MMSTVPGKIIHSLFGENYPRTPDHPTSKASAYRDPGWFRVALFIGLMHVARGSKLAQLYAAAVVFSLGYIRNIPVHATIQEP